MKCRYGSLNGTPPSRLGELALVNPGLRMVPLNSNWGKYGVATPRKWPTTPITYTHAAKVFAVL